MTVFFAGFAAGLAMTLLNYIVNALTKPDEVPSQIVFEIKRERPLEQYIDYICSIAKDEKDSK